MARVRTIRKDARSFLAKPLEWCQHGRPHGRRTELSKPQSIAAAVHTVDPEIAIAHVRTMDQVRTERLQYQRFNLTLYVAFAAIALSARHPRYLWCHVLLRSAALREIALRMALGADRNRVLALILKEAVLLALIGSVLGLIGAYFIGRSMPKTLFEVGKVG